MFVNGRSLAKSCKVKGNSHQPFGKRNEEKGKCPVSHSFFTFPENKQGQINLPLKGSTGN
jgi:hypothetical protein